jgi:hypothetical protein
LAFQTFLFKIHVCLNRWKATENWLGLSVEVETNKQFAMDTQTKIICAFYHTQDHALCLTKHKQVFITRSGVCGFMNNAERLCINKNKINSWSELYVLNDIVNLSNQKPHLAHIAKKILHFDVICAAGQRLIKPSSKWVRQVALDRRDELWIIDFFPDLWTWVMGSFSLFSLSSTRVSPGFSYYNAQSFTAARLYIC